MSGKQNFIFFLGVTLILVQLYFGGQLHILWSTIFPSKGSPAGTNPFNPRNPSPGQGLCPPGYHMVGGINGYCVKNGTHPGQI